MINFIKESFASLKSSKYHRIEIKGKFIEAWTFRTIEEYGVAIPYDEEDVYEQFSSVVLMSENMKLDGQIRSVLTLTCSIESLRNEFAVIASQFVEPGIDNVNRIEVQRRPREWWNRWSNLIGNAFVERNAYDIIAELISFEYLFDNNEKPLWRGPSGGSQDIITKNGSVEVKSTIRKYGAIISVNSQFQLNNIESGMRLFFVRLEKNASGFSIEDIHNRVVTKGVDQGMLNDNLRKAGIHKGSGLWKEKFKVLEKRVYEIDDRFPAITVNSFTDGKIPKGIIKIVYDVDLDSMRYDMW